MVTVVREVLDILVDFIERFCRNLRNLNLVREKGFNLLNLVEELQLSRCVFGFEQNNSVVSMI